MKSVLTIISLAWLVFLSACSATSTDFQSDADILRLEHLKYYGELLQEYKAKTGTYPFIGESEVPTYVFIASPKQFRNIQGGPAYEHNVVRFEKLVKEFESILGREINEYYDPQIIADSKPNFYIYMVRGNTYNLAIHTHEAFPFSNPIGKGYNKIEVTNNPNGAGHLIRYEDLILRQEFSDALSREVSKPRFFKTREQELIRITKAD